MIFMETTKAIKFNTPLEEIIHLQAELSKNYWKAGDHFEGLTKELETERHALITALFKAEAELRAQYPFGDKN